jgi:hypothetical protein
MHNDAGSRLASILLLITALSSFARAATEPATRPADSLLSPYDADPQVIWNRLHRALFLRTARDGTQYIHTVDPLLFENASFLLEGEPHQRAIAALDECLALPRDRMIADPLKRVFIQHDLWAAFDYLARPPYPWDDKPARSAAMLELRVRLARLIGRLELSPDEIAALPDNYTAAVKSNEFPTDHDPQNPKRPFLPADLFDPKGLWVRFTDQGGSPMTPQHFHAASGRAVHVVFLRLPGGREATLLYLASLKHGSDRQFPPGTMLAMVRRAVTVATTNQPRVTPVAELVQIRVYRRIPDDPRANFHGDFGEQDVYEFALDRAKFFAGEPGLRPVGAAEQMESFERNIDPFEHGEPTMAFLAGLKMTTLQTCTQCHQAPGIYSVLSVARRLQADPKDESNRFENLDWNVEMEQTLVPKVQQFDWGLLQGMLDAERR